MSVSRQLRRAAERQQIKAARQAAPSQANVPAATGPTGPRTAAGKAISSLNNLRHGLAGKFRVLDEVESQSEFDTVLAALRDEHQPATATEEILVARLAEHYWLSQRALVLQDSAIRTNSPEQLGLFLRYQTTNDRAFHKCLAELSKLQQAQRARSTPRPSCAASSNEFESQPPEPAPEFESQTVRSNDFESQDSEQQCNSAMLAEVRGLLGSDCAISDADLLILIQEKIIELCAEMLHTAAA
jgi:hypothetical protein